ncbi:hypothetical protein C0991_002369 [Blastosporella zonata]|nr:hypothetical protein C0991_002369 [Blastosporella zonata]
MIHDAVTSITGSASSDGHDAVTSITGGAGSDGHDAVTSITGGAGSNGHDAIPGTTWVADSHCRDVSVDGRDGGSTDGAVRKMAVIAGAAVDVAARAIGV